MSRWALLAAWALTACGSELELTGGSGAVETRPEVRVRTRPVCGNGVVEAGEICDDGNTDDGDGCDRDCRPPCAEDELELVGCSPGRTLRHRYEVPRQAGGPVSVTEQHDTLRCRVPSGEAFEVSVCRNYVEPLQSEKGCVNVVPPAAGERFCAPGCAAGCPEGTACLAAFADGSDPAERIGFLCLPAIGSGVGDACGTCGSGLSCNTIVGRESQSVCMPDSCAGGCPADAICAPAQNIVTGESVGEACFASADFPIGTRTRELAACADREALADGFVGDACDRGCRALQSCGGAWPNAGDNATVCAAECRRRNVPAFFGCIARQSGCNLQASWDRCMTQPPPTEGYCTRRCDGGGSCPAGWYCAGPFDGGEHLCALESASGILDPPPDEPPQRAFPSPSCAEDVDETCTFESACDPDCDRVTGCGPIPALGLCEGARLRYCEQQRVVSIDCAGRDLRCDFDPELARYDCVEGG